MQSPANAQTRTNARDSSKKAPDIVLIRCIVEKGHMDGAPVGTITQGGVHNDVGTDCLGVPWLADGGVGPPWGPSHT